MCGGGKSPDTSEARSRRGVSFAAACIGARALITTRWTKNYESTQRHLGAAATIAGTVRVCTRHVPKGTAASRTTAIDVAVD